jgi:AcrR family transcriptional regulator
MTRAPRTTRPEPAAPGAAARAGPEEPPARGRGRPRDRAADEAILAAAFRILVDGGYGGLSIEAVAAEAGVGKTTIYRRYPTKRDLVVAALNAATTVELAPSTAVARTAIRHLIGQVVRVLFAANGDRILGSFLVEEGREPELHEVFRARVLEPRRAMLVELLQGAVERGEVRADVDVDVVSEVLIGSVFAHYIRTGQYGEEVWVGSVVDTVWAGISGPD